MAVPDRSSDCSCVMPWITDLTAWSASNVQAARLSSVSSKRPLNPSRSESSSAVVMRRVVRCVMLERDRSEAVLGSGAHVPGWGAHSWAGARAAMPGWRALLCWGARCPARWRALHCRGARCSAKARAALHVGARCTAGAHAALLRRALPCTLVRAALQGRALLC
ncbi:unnamed protein product [Closterium sp. Naga37s-1]|nr:unnamed protein product [Closterium sp. Naga37s-1]